MISTHLLLMTDSCKILSKAGCTRHESYAFFERMRLVSWRHVLSWCVWYGLRSSRNLFLYWRIKLTALTHFYSNADHTRCIKKGRDVTKSDACAQKTHRTHAVCIQFKSFKILHGHCSVMSWT